jgi:uncharacterized protein (TIGR00369 family)
VLSFEADIPFVTELGFTLHKRAGGESELHYTPRPEHLNSFGVTHGGALMALLDVTMAQAASSMLPNTGGVTIEMKTAFMQPARGALVAKGVLLHKTHGGMAYTEGSVYDAEGRLCCKASGTFKLKRRDPASESAGA